MYMSLDTRGQEWVCHISGISHYVWSSSPCNVPEVMTRAQVSILIPRLTAALRQDRRGFPAAEFRMTEHGNTQAVVTVDPSQIASSRTVGDFVVAVYAAITAVTSVHDSMRYTVDGGATESYPPPPEKPNWYAGKGSDRWSAGSPH